MVSLPALLKVVARSVQNTASIFNDAKVVAADILTQQRCRAQDRHRFDYYPDDATLPLPFRYPYHPGNLFSNPLRACRHYPISVDSGLL
jgi:hypothetical protein